MPTSHFPIIMGCRKSSPSFSKLVGIDGGGSRSRFLMAEESGAVIDLFIGGPLNINNNSEARLKDVLLAGFDGLNFNELCRQSKGSVYAGVAGIKGRDDAELFTGLVQDAMGDRVNFVEAANDSDILLAGGLLGRPGIALILGTGSHCLGRDSNGRTATCGGWGYLMDDCGSGYSLGHAALRLTVRTWDGRADATDLSERVRKYLNIEKPEQVLKRVYNQDLGFEGVKELSRIVVELASNGDPHALELCQTAANETMELVDQVGRELQFESEVDVVLSGGVAKSPVISDLVCRAIESKHPGYRILEPQLPPVAGAIIRSAQSIGITINSQFISNLTKGLEPHLIRI